MALPKGNMAWEAHDGPGHRLGPCSPGLGLQQPEVGAWGGHREEVGHRLSRAGWVLCKTCWGNGCICGCRCPGFGESRVQPSCHTRRSVAGRKFCLLMGQGQSGTRGSASFTHRHGTHPGATLSPRLSAGSSSHKGGVSGMHEDRAGHRRACWGQDAGRLQECPPFPQPARWSVLSSLHRPSPALGSGGSRFPNSHLPQPGGISRQLLPHCEALLTVGCSHPAEENHEMIATQSQVACEPRAACAHWRLLGLKLGTPCSLHEWVELIFLAFTLTIPPPCVCPHPARGSELASGTGAQSPLFPHCLSA